MLDRLSTYWTPHQEPVAGFCTIPPCLAMVFCLACYVGFKRSVARARPEIELLVEDLRILIEKGQVDRARSRLLAARGPLAGVLSGLGPTWDEVRGRPDDGMEQAAGAAVSGVGRGWKFAARFVADFGRLGTIACLGLMFLGLTLWESPSDDAPRLPGVLLAMYALICLLGVRIVGSATCKLMEKELRWLREQVLQALPATHSLTRGARVSPSS